MKRSIIALLALGVLAAGGLTGVRIHRIEHSWWLIAYLVLAVIFPLVAGVVGLNQGRVGFKSLVQTLFAVAAGLVVLTLVYQVPRTPGPGPASRGWSCRSSSAASRGGRSRRLASP